MQLVASPDGRDGSLTIGQDARVYLADVEQGQEVGHEKVGAGRGVWLQVLRGAVEVDGTRLSAGDGVAIDGEPGAGVRAVEGAEVLVFDLR